MPLDGKSSLARRMLQEPFSLTWVTFNPSIDKFRHIPGKVWDENTYPFPNFNGAAVGVWEWMSNFTPDFVIDVITYPYWD